MDRCSNLDENYDDVGLQLAANVWGLADKGRPSKIWNFLRYTVFDQKPYVVTWNGCTLASISEGSYGNCGGWVYSFITDEQLEVVFTL